MKTTKAKHTPSARKVVGLYQRNDRNGSWWYKRVIDGKAIYVDLQTKDYVAAVQAVARLQHSAQMQPTTGMEREISFCVEERMKTGHWRENTLAGRKHMLAIWCEWCRNAEPQSITKRDAQAYYDWLLDHKQVKPISANAYIACLGSVWEWFRDNGKVLINPWHDVKRTKVKQVNRDIFIPFAEFERLIEEAPDDDLRFILFCGFHAGMRRDEIVNAKASWFDLERDIITIRDSDVWQVKNGGRWLPLSPPFKDFLLRWGMREPFLLKPDVTKGSWRYRYDFRRPFEKYMWSQGHRDMTIHAMRHSFASFHVGEGTDLLRVATWLGDGYDVVKQHYAHLQKGDTKLADTWREAKARLTAQQADAANITPITQQVQNCG